MNGVDLESSDELVCNELILLIGVFVLLEIIAVRFTLVLLHNSVGRILLMACNTVKGGCPNNSAK